MRKLRALWNSTPWYVKNPYTIAILAFVIWMLFIDKNSFISQWSVNRKLSELEDRKTYYLEETNKVDLLKEELFSTDENKEKFAREHYLMKKDDEDIFVIVEKD